jgi:RHS repeat-associated protein
VDAEGNDVAGWSYRYDVAGNPVEVVDAEGRTVHYVYDPSGQITEEKRSDGSVVKYSYQAGGNRAAREADGESTVYEYDEADRLLKAGDETFAYDENGNLIERKGPEGVTRYEYDAEDRLVQVTLPDGGSLRYGYSPTGERIWREDSKGRTWHVTDGVNLVAELDENLAPEVTYLHGLDVDCPLAMSQEDEDFFLHVDSLGSIRTLSDENGATAASYAYDAFGRIEKRHGNVQCSLTFTAREFDGVTGLYYYRSRFYDADLGRFLSADRYSGTQDDPLSLNRYAYVKNAPTRFVDPLGAAAEERSQAQSNDRIVWAESAVVSGTVASDIFRPAITYGPSQYGGTGRVPLVGGRSLVAQGLEGRNIFAGLKRGVSRGVAARNIARNTAFGAGLIYVNVTARTSEERTRNTASFVGGFVFGTLVSAVLFGTNPVGLAAAGAFVTSAVVGGLTSAHIDEQLRPVDPSVRKKPISRRPLFPNPLGGGVSRNAAFGGSIGSGAVSSSLLPILAGIEAVRSVIAESTNFGDDLHPPGDFVPSTSAAGNGLDSHGDYRDRAEADVDLVIQKEASRLDRALTEREVAAVRERIRNAQANWENQQIYGGNYGDQGYGGQGNQGYWDEWSRQWSESMFEGWENMGDNLGGGIF